jgi:hypothetical protein
MYALFRAFEFLITIVSKYLKDYSKVASPTPFFFYSFPPLPYLFHPSYLPSVFASYFSPFPSLPLSHFVASALHVFDRLTVLASPPNLLCSLSVPFLFSLSSFPLLNLAIVFSLLHTLSPLPITGPCLCSSTFLFTFSLSPFSPGRFLFFSPSSRNFSLVSPLSHPI